MPVIKPVARSHLQTVAGGTAATRTGSERGAERSVGRNRYERSQAGGTLEIERAAPARAVQMINSWLEQKRMVAVEEEEDEGGG